MIIIPFGTLLAFILGAIIGSFLNVVILRMNTGKGIGGRSICFSCSKQLSASELVPIVSFLMQRGRCKGCRTPIAWQYPIVEIMTGLAFALIAANPAVTQADLGQWLAYFAFYASAFSLLIVISAYDWRHKIIPDRAVYLFIVLAVFSPLFAPAVGTYFGSVWLDHAVAGVALSIPFALLWLLSKGRLMGFGDAKLALGMGLLLGLSQGVAAIMLAFWIGAAAGVILLLLRRTALTIKSEIPFAPFLALGTALAFLCHIDLAALSMLFTWG